MDIEAQCAVDTHLALETGVVGEELAHEIAVEGEAEDVAPKGERGFVLRAIDLAVDAFLVSQTDADAQAVVESVLRHDVPVEGLAYPHDVALPAAQEIKRVVGLLDYQELAGHPGEGEVIAHLGFGYFTERDGYVEVFYHLSRINLVVLPKGRYQYLLAVVLLYMFQSASLAISVWHKQE